MTHFVALVEAAEAGELTCVECGCNVVVRDPETDRLTLCDAMIVRDEARRFRALCDACR